MMLAGVPDLSRPVESVPGSAYWSFGGTHVALVPDALSLERQEDGSPALLLTLIRPEDANAEAGRSGRLDVGFTVEAPLRVVGEALVAQRIPARVVPAELVGGVLGVSTHLGTGADSQLVPPVELSPSMLTRARVVADLNFEGAVLARRLLEDRTLPVRALLRLAFPAVAPRVPLTLQFNRRRLAEVLAGRLGDGAVVAGQALTETLDALLGDPVLTVTGDPATVDQRLRADVLAMHLWSKVAVPDLASADGYRLLPAAEVPEELCQADLSKPTQVTAERVLTMDPFAAARQLSGGSLEHCIRRVEVPRLSTGHLQVSFMANLPQPMADLLALFADLRIPAAPPLRPEEVTVGVRLAPPDWTATVEIVLSPDEPFAGEARLRALLGDGDATLEQTGAWRLAATDRLLLGPEFFPLPLTVVRASRALTDVATVTLKGASGRVVARLDATTPVIAVVRGLVPSGTLLVEPVGAGRAIELPLEETPRIDLDPMALPGFGVHRAKVVGRAGPGRPPVLVEWRPEAGDLEPQAVRLGADRSEAEISWVAVSPFQPGLVWRVTHGGAPGPWSGPVMPADELVLTVEAAAHEPVVLDGLELRPDPADPSVWTYVPPGPFLEAGPGGRLALGVVDAGSVSFLQLTSRLDLPDAARDVLSSRLPARDGGHPPAVRAVPVAVTRVAVETRPADGNWATVTEGTSSGIPPWNTALAATLTAEQADAVKAAIGGARGRMRLVGEMAAAGRTFVQDKDVADLLGAS
jgi:hypothetical protein